MKNLNVMMLVFLMSVSACSKKDKSGDSGGDSPTVTGSTSGSGDGTAPVNNEDNWDPDAEEGWLPPVWGSDDNEETSDPTAGAGSTAGADTGGSTTVGSAETGGSSAPSDNSAGVSGGSVEPVDSSTSSTTTAGVSDGGTTTSGSTSSGSVDTSAGTSSGSADATVGSSDGSATTTTGSTTVGSVDSTSGSTTTPEEPLQPGEGYLTVAVTDAPFPFDWIEYAKVTLFKVEVRSVSSGCFIKVYDIPTEFDLMQLRNGVTSTLTKAKLPMGAYDQVRLFVSKGEVKLKDGRVFPLKVPSGETSGIKLLISPGIKVYAASTSEVLLDIDAAKSFMVQGNTSAMSKITGFKFLPVARASNIGGSGRVTGSVMNDNGTPNNLADDKPISGATVRVARLGQTVVSAVTSNKGTYQIIGVPAETYSVLFAVPGFESKEYGPISVAVNQSVPVVARLAGTPEVVLPLTAHVIKPELNKGSTDIVAELISYNGAVTVEATNGLACKIVLTAGRYFVVAKANSLGLGVVTLTDKKGQTSSFSINQIPR